MSFRMFIDLMNEPVPTRWQTPQQFAVLCALANFANEKHGNWAWPSMKSIGEKVKLSERHVSRVIQELKELGLVEIVSRSAGRNRARNSYRLIVSTHDVHVRSGGTSRQPAALRGTVTPDAPVSGTHDIHGSAHDAYDRSTHDTRDRSLRTPVSGELTVPTPISTLKEENTQGERACGAGARPPKANAALQNTHPYRSPDFDAAIEIARAVIQDTRRIHSPEDLLAEVMNHLAAEPDLHRELDCDGIMIACSYVWTSTTKGRRTA